MGIAGDQIAGAVGISLMLLMLIHRVVRANVPRGRFLRMALVWAAIVVFVTIVVLMFQPRI